MSTALPLVHRIHHPAVQRPHPPLLILLHGIGSNELDLLGLAPELDSRLLVLSARAPLTLGPGSYAWFPIDFTPNGTAIDAVQAERSRRLLLDFVDQAVQHYGAHPQQVFIGGFSQGCIMSFSAALTEPEKFAGVVGMSGRILPQIRPLLASPDRLKNLHAIWVHGTEDAILPIEYGRQARDLLLALGVQLEYYEFPMGHWVTPESLGAIRRWLSRRLDQLGA